MSKKAPNALLREWRNTNRLTRLEVADQVNATPTGVSERLACDEERVRRWETGEVRWPSTFYRLALTQLTGLTPEQLGFSRPVRDQLVTTPVAPTDAPQASQAPGHAGGADRAVEEAELRLATDQHITAALDWLDRQAGWEPGNSRRKVASRLVSLDPRRLRDHAQARSRIGRDQVAEALTAYYATAAGDAELRTYRVRDDGDLVTTSLATKPNWLGLDFPLGAGADDFTLTETTRPALPMGQPQAEAAVTSLAESLTAGRRIVNAPLYRMTTIDIGAGRLGGGFGISEFVHYALTMDLLEKELLDALADGRPIRPGELPLRDHYLPDLETVANPAARLCAGGPLALCAIARPGVRARKGRPDYLILVQERSGNVLNAARKLAVIPKAFHGPMADFGEDVSIPATIEREMEEELFGRDEVDSTFSNQRHADPMHPSRLSEPMAWLTQHPDHWRMECTGFGFNLVSGNFEFASLLVIDDEEWWTRFGGHIAANWESSGLRRYSTLDTHLIAALMRDPAWSNEGLFAFCEGLRRLSRTGGDRLDLPAIEVEL